MATQFLTDEQNNLLNAIEAELYKKDIPLAKNQKKGITGRRTIVFGYRRWYTRHIGPGRWNTLKPNLWNLLKQYGATIPIQWDSVQINQDATCGRHTDSNNAGLSYIVSLGNYTGGDLIMEIPDDSGSPTTTFNCLRKPLIFDGSVPHWNTPHTGRKYSIVFYPIDMPDWWLRRKEYPPNWREHPEYIECMKISTPVVNNGPPT